MKFYYETLLMGDWQAKHIVEEKGYIRWVTLHPHQSIRKWKEQKKTKKDRLLQIEGEMPQTHYRAE